MNAGLDLFDIQGSIVKAYGRYGFPRIRYVFYRIHDGDGGRRFVNDLVPLITNSVPWTSYESIPTATTNIAFTYEGLKKLGVPEASLHSFPEEFSMGMKARRDILGDTGPNDPSRWDPIWQSDTSEQPVHMAIWINGKSSEDVERRYEELVALQKRQGECVEQLAGHRGADGDNLPYQEASVLYDEKGRPTNKEHFGYADGISEPFFKGCGSSPDAVIGGGKPTGRDPATRAGWEPLETGEFILGHKDEAFEYPHGPIPSLLARNGTFMVYRKLHENVATFNAFLKRVGATYPDGEEGLAAKFAGRWRNGAPLVSFPTRQQADQFMADYLAAQQEARNKKTSAARARYEELKKKLVAFDYNDDLAGARCPVGAHTRRVNPRGALEFGRRGAYATPGALTNRRRIIRRGLPYGKVVDPSRDDGDHGVIFVVLNASINRQFEFVQQQWIEYGNDFKLANDKDPLLGNHGLNEQGEARGRMVIEADPAGDSPPFFCNKMPTFVETRGGDYFFIPSLTAVRMIGDGIIDPT